jgi:1,4-dihydroxy-2-naphthoate octaprenyltransferase
MKATFVRLVAFLRLSRPMFLAGGLAGGGLGTAVACYETGRVSWLAYALAQATISAFHLMTHYANDYFDREADRLTTPGRFSGGSGTLVDGSLAPLVAWRAALVCAALGALGSVALFFSGRPAAAALGLALGALAWSYSAPPLRLLARGLGELDAALVVAVLVPLCAYAAQTGGLDPLALASVVPGAFAMLAMMLCVEYPDEAADAAGGKRNLLVRLGRRKTAALLAAFLVAMYLGVLTALAAGAPRSLAFFELLTVPLTAGLVLAVTRRPGGAQEPDESLAARGVTLFFLVSFFALLAYASETRSLSTAVEGHVMTETATLHERVEGALDRVRPAIQSDGGDVWLIKIEDRVAYVQMLGACGGCAMSTATLKGAIEANVMADCPEIERVEQV